MRWLRRDLHYYLLLVVPLAYFLLFKYVPMYGLSLAFRKFQPGGPSFGTEWVGLRYFAYFIADPSFWNVVKNTLLLSVLGLVIGFPLPIIFALLLNEVRNRPWKRFVQTVSYLPRFLSTVIVVGMINQVLSPSGGIVNAAIEALGGEKIHFLTRPEWFRPIYIASDIWQYLGWSAIIYLAALAGVDTELYDAAQIDGAGRWGQTLHVTLPSILPTITIMLILQTGSILSVGHEKVLLLYNPLTYQTGDVISTFVYRVGIINSSYSYATAVGLFNGAVALVVIWAANAVARRVSETSLW